jgi:predicted phosphodiesterase
VTLKLHIMSDLHLEFHGDDGEEFVKRLNPEGVDALVLAGDIVSLRFYHEAEVRLKQFCDKYKHVFYVPGNHEYYRCFPEASAKLLKALPLNIPNLYILEPGNVKVLDGQRFIGGTMWFRNDADNIKYQSLLNDFYQIKKFVPWVYEQNALFCGWIGKSCQPGDIVISHHMPSPKSVHPRWVGSALNRFFLCDMELYIQSKKPKLWIHGHTHDPFDYSLEGCRVVCNPLGYPGENVHFDDRKIVEV